MVKKSKNLEPVIVSESKLTEEIKLAIFNISLSSLDENFEKCEDNSQFSKRGKCYELIVNYIYDKLKSKLGVSWSVTVGENLKFFSQNDNDLFYIEFFIGDIGFDVEKLGS